MADLELNLVLLALVVSIHDEDLAGARVLRPHEEHAVLTQLCDDPAMTGIDLQYCYIESMHFQIFHCLKKFITRTNI